MHYEVLEHISKMGHISEDAKMVVTSLIDWSFQHTFLHGIHNTGVVLELN